MVSACHDAGLETPVFEEIGVRYRVTLSITQVQEPTLDKLDAAIVGLIRTADGLATHEIAQKISLTPRARNSPLAGDSWRSRAIPRNRAVPVGSSCTRRTARASSNSQKTKLSANSGQLSRLGR
jgi:hypothetical protein